MNTDKNIAFWFALITILFLLLVIGMVGRGFGLEAKTPSKDEVKKILEEQADPYTYVEGRMASGYEIYDEKDHDKILGAAVFMWPKYGSVLSAHYITFCGDVAKRFTVTDAGDIYQGTVVITYKTQASRLVGSVPCHELKGVDVVDDGTQ